MLLSIITPSFRQIDWLRLAMASVADQRGVEIEHIIQDGGSEGIREMFEELSSSSATQTYRPRLFVEKDNGMYDAINRGLSRASGDICAYLNCDEQYLPDALRDVANYFDKHPDMDVMFGDSIL